MCVWPTCQAHLQHITRYTGGSCTCKLCLRRHSACKHAHPHRSKRNTVTRWANPLIVELSTYPACAARAKHCCSCHAFMTEGLLSCSRYSCIILIPQHYSWLPMQQGGTAALTAGHQLRVDQLATVNEPNIDCTTRRCETSVISSGWWVGEHASQSSLMFLMPHDVQSPCHGRC